MKKFILPLALSILVFSCAEEKPKEETPAEPNGINISVKDDSMNANININGEEINVKTDDGKEANFKVNKDGIDIKSGDGEEAHVKLNNDGMDIKSKDGETKVKMDKSGNMNIKTPDGKEINVNVKDAVEAK